MTRPVVRVLTPPGTGAIATVEVRGPEAWAAVRRRFTTASGRALPETPPPHRAWVGTLGDGSHADEVVVAVKQQGPDEIIEVHCHGGRQVVRWVSELLGTLSIEKPTRRDGWARLPHAHTLRNASILLDQCHGAFDRAVGDTFQSLESNPKDAGSKLDALARYAPLGRHLVGPWRVVVAGEPNVGKSSLVNALTGFQRSVVSETAGTTRDVVSTLTAIDGWPVELVDTAGLRRTVDPLETEGVGRAQAARIGADLIVWVVDGNRPPTTTQGSEFVVINKIDLLPGWDWNAIPTGVRVSASTGAGIPDLMSAVSARLVPDPPPAGAAVPYSPALADAVVVARTAYLSGNFDETRRRLATCRGHIS